MIGRLLSWLRAVMRPGHHRRQIDEELRFHLEREIEDRIAHGATPREARRLAHVEFGSVDAIREECREARGTRLTDSTLQDVRYGIRMMGRYPAFTATAVLTLALTIGAVATVLTLVEEFSYSRWAVEGADEIVEVQVTRQEGSRIGRASWREYLHFRERTRALDRLEAAYPTAPLHVGVGEETTDVNGAVVSAGLLSMLRLRPALGRFFSHREDRLPDRDAVVVLGHDFWRRWYGEDEGALGARLEINGRSFRVVGVMPRSFAAVDAQPIDLWLPSMMFGVGYRWCAVLEQDDCTIVRLYGRRAQGVSIASVEAEMESLQPAWWADAEAGDNSGTRVVEVRGRYQSDADRSFMSLLFWVTGLLFVVCCANLAGLLIARSRAREGELAARAALGASRSRLVRQLLTEALLLALVGGAAGVAASYLLTGMLETTFYSLDSSGRTLVYDLSPGPAVLAGTTLAALIAALVFGLLPAVGLARGAASLERGRADRRSTAGSHRWLLALQAAGAMVLTVLGGLLATSAASRLRTDDLDVDRIALLRLRPRLAELDAERAAPYLRAVLERIEGLSGVESVSMVGTGIALLGFGAEVGLPDGPVSPVGYIEVGPDYFRTLGTRVVRGREFDDSDDLGAAPVAVVSEALARRLWEEADPIGEAIVVDGQERTVVGVVADVALQARAYEQRPYAYVPFWQNPDAVDARLQVRVRGAPTTSLPDLVEAARSVDPTVPVTEAITMRWRVSGLFRPVWMSATVVGYAAVLAVFLAAVGLYSSLAAAVTRRRREIGVRQALGATSRRVLALIAVDGARLVAAGIVAGVGLAAFAVRWLDHMLYGAASADLLSYLAAAALVAAIGFTASLLPALQAARIDPMRALRGD